jgi:hypothetical protein
VARRTTARSTSLTGEEIITPREQIAVLGRVLGRTLSCVAVPPEVAIEHARKRGLPEAILETLRKLWTSAEAGQAANRHDGVSRRHRPRARELRSLGARPRRRVPLMVSARQRMGPSPRARFARRRGAIRAAAQHCGKSAFA